MFIKVKSWKVMRKSPKGRKTHALETMAAYLLTGADKGCGADSTGCSKSRRWMEKLQPTRRHLTVSYLLICSIHIAAEEKY